MEKIKQTYGLSLCDQANFNLLETYDSPHGEIFGLIWTNDTVFFCYSIPPSLKVADHIVLTKKTYAGLDDEQKHIISGDKDWNNKIFQNKSGSPKLITPPSHYLLSTVIKTISSFDIKSITFSY